MIASSALQEALHYAGDTHTLGDIEQGVKEGKYQLWEGDDSALVTEILQAPNPAVRTLHFWLAGGNLMELKVMVPAILEWGKAQGCTRTTMVGRFGWLRSFVKDLGFKEWGVIMQADL